MLIAEDLFLLLLYADKGSFAVRYPELVLGGALLADLEVRGVLEIEAHRCLFSPKLHVIQAAAVDDPLLATALERVDRPRTSRDLVERLSRGAVVDIGTRLAASGHVEARESKVLGLFTRRRWPERDAGHRTLLAAHLDDVLTSRTEPDPRTRAVVALLVAADKLGRVSHQRGAVRRDAHRYARELAKHYWPADGVRAALRARESSGGD